MLRGKPVLGAEFKVHEFTPQALYATNCSTTQTTTRMRMKEDITNKVHEDYRWAEGADWSYPQPLHVQWFRALLQKHYHTHNSGVCLPVINNRY